MAEAPVSIVLAGIGGMGAVYVRELLEHAGTGAFTIAGAVDPEPARCPRLDELKETGVPVFATLEEFYGAGAADLAVISSPIQFHAGQTRLALEQGSHVLCEKPAAATIQDVRAMIAAEKASGKTVAVGYQWSFSPAVQALKADIMAGVLGRPKRLKCLYLWPRDEAYYGRNSWAGRKRDRETGAWILDSPAQNAMAHDLHNIFYVLGPEVGLCDPPVEVQAELHRANAIENFDTAAVRARTAGGAEIFFVVSHAPAAERGPVYEYEFERGVVRCSSRTSGIWAELADGTRKDYGVPDDKPMAKLWEAVRRARTGERPVCGLEAASGQTLCVNAIQDSVPEVRELPDVLRRVREVRGSRRVFVEGLDEALTAAFEAGRLPSEAGVAWAAPGRRVRIAPGYSFPSAVQD